MITSDDIREFIDYLIVMTDNQVLNVMDREYSAGRQEYAELAIKEAEIRGII